MTRIKETISQVKTDVSGKWMSIEEAEKLAELIVAECIQQVNEALPESNIGAYRTARITALGKIKQHFGITE